MDHRRLEGLREVPGGRRTICATALPYRGNAFRVVHALQIGDDIWVVHAFQKKSTQGINAAALTVRKAEARTGLAAADFPRIRNADPGRFTIDRLIRVLERLDAKVDVQVTVRPQAQLGAPPAAL